jgi:hypothetical protein
MKFEIITAQPYLSTISFLLLGSDLLFRYWLSKTFTLHCYLKKTKIYAHIDQQPTLVLLTSNMKHI